MSSSSKKPVCIIAIGMAGSGKSTFVHRLSAHLLSKSPPAPPYLLNLDPAVANVPYDPNIDIRDTVDYHEVMKQYNLGPNGGILTSLNLFTTKFDQVLDLVEKRAETVDYVIIDTPGQIEIFTWSASGAIITDAVASALPTVVAYIVDTPRSVAPATFMSNMLYACSILYKTKLPFIVVFNKIDVEPHAFALDWMRDFEVFQESLASHQSTTDDEGAPTYMNSLMNSMSLVLDEFYKHLKSVGVSSVTGDGISEFLGVVEASREEYEKDYLPELARVRAQREATLQKRKEESTARMLADLNVDRARDPNFAAQDRWNPDGEEQEEEDDGGELNIIDRSEDPWPGQYIDLTQPRARETTWPRPA
ncbi:XPA-binding protein 1 [Russula earlei]|uniref:XPA-binding protein 1 n=1 Tax=Russula earlei TaxID=71964 RepID=A0ACC0U558_9AGAM|nr:XPA-binding protein 1 [Russula earlei]